MHGAASMNWLNHESGGLQGLSAPVIGRLHAETDWLPVRVQKRHLNWVGGVLEDPWSFPKISGSLEAESNFLTWRWLTSHEWPKPTMSIFQRPWESWTKGELLNHLLVCVSMCPCTRYVSKSILIRFGVLKQRQNEWTSMSAGWQDLDVAGEKYIWAGCSCSTFCCGSTFCRCLSTRWDLRGSGSKVEVLLLVSKHLLCRSTRSFTGDDFFQKI